MVPVSAPRHHAERRAGKGTPTSGQFSRWGPAQPAAGGRQGRTPSWRVVRLSAGIPAFSIIRTAAWYTPLAALRAAVPTRGWRVCRDKQLIYQRVMRCWRTRLSLVLPLLHPSNASLNCRALPHLHISRGATFLRARLAENRTAPISTASVAPLRHQRPSGSPFVRVAKSFTSTSRRLPIQGTAKSSMIPRQSRHSSK